MDLQPYSHNSFSKISRAFFASRNQWIIVVFLQCRLKVKLPFVLINTLLLRIPLLALTDRWMEWQTEEQKTLAGRGLEEPFFPVVRVSVFWFWREISFGVTYIRRVQYSCGIVLVFWFWWEIVFVFAYVLSVQYSCVVESFFGCGGKEFPCDLWKILIGFLYFTEKTQ